MMKVRALLILLTLSFGLISSVEAANPKAGEKCAKVGKKLTFKGLEFTCTKKNAKLVWSKGVKKSFGTFEVGTPSPGSWSSAIPTGKPASSNPAVDPNVNYLDLYRADPNPPSDWIEFQKFVVTNNYHTGPLRFVEKSLGANKPNLDSYLKSSTSDIALCKPKLVHSYPVLGFVNEEDKQRFFFNRHPSPSTKFQVLPVQWREYQGKNSPKQDYGRYFTFMENWIKNISDNGSNVEVRIPDRYYTLPKGIDEYTGIDTHGKPTEGGKIFFLDAVASADPFIDFTGSNMILLVVPPNTPIKYLGNQPWSSNPRSNEGNLSSILTNPPYDLTTWHRNHLLGTPGAWMHEIWHAGLDIGDHSGEGAMGNWGSMSSMEMDLMGWEKYIAGFFSDAQVICASKNSENDYWIIPSSIKGPHKKLLVLPISESRVIVIESMRSYGYNYKLPERAQGALVYIIDTSKTGYHQGEYVVVPPGRSDPGYLDAPLKMGESMTIEGYQIKVIEAGLFGEVIRVKPVG